MFLEKKTNWVVLGNGLSENFPKLTENHNFQGIAYWIENQAWWYPVIFPYFLNIIFYKAPQDIWFWVAIFIFYLSWNFYSLLIVLTLLKWEIQ